MKQHTTITFVNDLIGVLLQNLIYYIPSELITGEVLTQIEENIPDSFFDELSLFDLEKGVFLIHNEDTFAINKKLLEKRALLENNLFSLLQKRKEITPMEFEFMLQKYNDQLVFFLFITDWLISNLKKYHKEVLSLPLIGSFKLQHEYLLSHLKEIHNYFAASIDIEKEYHFTAEKLVMEYFPDLISRCQQVTLSIHYNDEVYTVNDEISAKPNFSILIYPVISMNSEITHKGSRINLLGEAPSEKLIEKYSNELEVNSKTPMAFLIHATDDTVVPVENSINYYLALKNNQISAELHLFDKGGHGFGLGLKGTSEYWPKLLQNWLTENNLYLK